MSWDEKAVQAALNRTVNHVADGPDHETVPVRREDLRALREIALARDVGKGELCWLDALDRESATFINNDRVRHVMKRMTWQDLGQPLMIHVKAKRSDT